STSVRDRGNDGANKGQLAWGHPNLIGSVYLNPAPSAGAATNTPAPTSAAASEVELEFWRSIKDSNKIEELNAYLTNYPSGTFKALALARIAALQDGPTNTTRNLTTGAVDQAIFSDEATQVTEDQLGLSKTHRRDVRRPPGLGFDTKATGKFDEATRTVITRWQAARGYPKTGYLNAMQHKALLSEILSTRVVSSDEASEDEPRASRRSSGGGGRRYHSGGGGGGGGGAPNLFPMLPVFP